MPGRHVALVLLPGFSMLALGGAVSPLVVANQLRQQQNYRWQLLSVDGRSVLSGEGPLIEPHASIEATEHPSLVLLLAGFNDGQSGHDRRLIHWLRRLERTRGDCRLGAVDGGVAVLAQAGLLEGHRCAAHWALQQNLAERFPRVEVTRELFCIDGNRLTCAGGAAVLDLMLTVIVELDGRQAAADVAEYLLHARLRTADESQRAAVQWRYRVHDRRLVKAIGLMEQNIEHPLSMGELSAAAGVSSRQLERLFARQFGMTPSRFYLDLRLRRARLLLLQSSERIHRIAAACGFTDASHFGKAYREVFGERPTDARKANRSERDHESVCA